MRTLSGIQPSGALHLGNYFGALRQFVELQKEEGEALYFIANLHALTTTRDGEALSRNTAAIALDFLALGLDPQKSILFRQSDVPFHAELHWLLGTVTPLALLERGHSYKDKLARGFGADVGLFTYPVLMAADILLYRTDRVPVGKDQKQHLEIARDIATKFNLTYVPGYDPQDPEGRENKKHTKGILKLPEPFILDSTAVVPGTDGQKMSKSYGNAIDLFGTDKELKKQIMGIVTDSTPVEAPKDPDASNLFLLLKLFLSPSEIDVLAQSFRQGGTGYGAYKKQLLDAFHAAFDPARARRLELQKDMGEIEAILQDGAQRAEAIARPVIEEVRRAVGVTGR
ncbi:MAG: tryptophan--tRNA ligase [Myxococcales bacterium]|jgi:tryptophanyl-tRNA synthetase|nr:tryptophan--tRNA ligase [Myxococcales bacterium]